MHEDSFLTDSHECMYSIDRKAGRQVGGKAGGQAVAQGRRHHVCFAEQRGAKDVMGEEKNSEIFQVVYLEWFVQ